MIWLIKMQEMVRGGGKCRGRQREIGSWRGSGGIYHKENVSLVIDKIVFK